MTSNRADSAVVTPRLVLDRSLATLTSSASAWAARSLGERIDDIRQIRERTFEVAPDLVADALRAKGIGQESAGEEWASGPMAVLRTLRFLQETLEGIRRTGEVPLSDGAFLERPDGQVTVDVMPGDGWDRVLYRGITATVRMDPTVRKAQARRSLGGAYTGAGFSPGVSLVLGAGNVSSIAPLDLVHKLFAHGHVTMLKFNPVNDYIAPYVEYAFEHLMDGGFVRTARGGADIGEYLVHHPDVDDVHITGSEATHDAIVFGSGEEGQRRRSERRPLLGKPITSELGNVSPTIVVGGSWSGRALRYHAEHVATQLVQNAGYNCVAAKALIVPEAWPQADEFLEMVGTSLASLDDRPAYYPGSLERYERVVAAGGRIARFGDSADGLPPTLIEIEPAAEHPAFSEEAFCRLMAVVRLPGADPASYLDAAVDFSNDRLRGTLNATLLADPGTIRSHRGSIERSIDRLRYGTVALNIWAAAGYALGVTPWGGHPGDTLEDVASGIGFVHNARLIDHPAKTVVRAPFIISPKPVWSVFHRRSASALRLATAFEASPSIGRLVRLMGAAARS